MGIAPDTLHPWEPQASLDCGESEPREGGSRTRIPGIHAVQGQRTKTGCSRVGKGVFPAPIPHLCPQEWPAADTSVLAANPGGVLRDRPVPGG